MGGRLLWNNLGRLITRMKQQSNEGVNGQEPRSAYITGSLSNDCNAPTSGFVVYQASALSRRPVLLMDFSRHEYNI